MDKIIRATAGNGFIKMAVISATETVERARTIHELSHTASTALGRTLCAASLMGQAQKEEKATLTIRINGGGPIGSIVAVSDCDGNVRGYVENPAVELPRYADGKLNVGGAVGRDGMLTVSRDLGMREPYIGSVELMSGEIAEDVTLYLTESEQVPSACAFGVLVDRDQGFIHTAGGFIVQLMPGAEPEMIEALEDNIFMMDQLTTILEEDGVEEIFNQVLKGFEYHIVGEYPMEYRCYCSRERVEEAISCIEKTELEEMAAEGKDVSVACHFCDVVYSFSPEELLEIAAKKIEEF